MPNDPKNPTTPNTSTPPTSTTQPPLPSTRTAESDKLARDSAPRDSRTDAERADDNRRAAGERVANTDAYGKPVEEDTRPAKLDASIPADQQPEPKPDPRRAVIKSPAELRREAREEKLAKSDEAKAKLGHQPGRRL